ncbi:hypothetical protein O181_066068 [Austropuccinia psidii MF-1]|uniref:Uncharacterized protein n=1 Tax=Austropuccinia psidii MF-1 TaxID=1389203 RepID=A0A9Q3EQR6_9BASI|nr:hypothetical protein [Austropuccinia psidii MF-1]
MKSQGSTPVAPQETEVKGKGKIHSESLITTKKWTQITTKRIIKPWNSASLQGKPTLIACTGKITVINPVVTSKGKFPKEVESKFVKGTVKGKYPKPERFLLHENTDISPVHLRNLGIPGNQPEDREGLFRTRRPGRGHLGYSGVWQDTEGNHTHPVIHLPIQQKPQTRGLEVYGSSSSAPPTPQRSIPMEHGQPEVQPSITLGQTWRKFPEGMSQRDTLERTYGNHQRMEYKQAVPTPGGEGNQDKGKSSHYTSYRIIAETKRA